jgi:diguanylate cyclase
MLCAKVIKNASGGNYLAIRFGGEEFLMICPELGRVAAMALAEQIRYQIESTQVTIRGKTIPVTISGGVTQFKHGESIEDLIGRADQALYMAKENGRNRVMDL